MEDLSDAFLTVRLAYVFWRGALRYNAFLIMPKHRLSAPSHADVDLDHLVNTGLSGSFPSKVTSRPLPLSVLPVWQGVTVGNTHASKDPSSSSKAGYLQKLPQFCTEFFHTHSFIQSFLWSWIPTYLFCTQGCNTHFLIRSVILIVPTWASWSFFWLLRRATVWDGCVLWCARVCVGVLWCARVSLLPDIARCSRAPTCICSAPVLEP